MLNELVLIGMYNMHLNLKAIMDMPHLYKQNKSK